MQNAAVLHFSTHGMAGWTEAERSRLKLADGDLTLPEIFDLHLERPRLAVLSACETGVPGLELPDEVESLPGGMMQAGIPGVVGSLWSVNDLSTAILIARFYELWREEGLPAPQALRQAQIWLRDLAQDEEKLQEPESLLPENIAAHLTPSQVDDLIKRIILDILSHPFYWAAFTYTGI
jgi:CHAT domain-containing protein